MSATAGLDPLPKQDAKAATEDAKHPFLVALGGRVRDARARRGMTRKALAAAAGVSPRHLANLEYGVGNVSVLVLRDVARALQCPVAELLGDVTASNPEWLLLRGLLGGRDEDTLRRVRTAVAAMLDTSASPRGRGTRIALIGLRGAGKSSLGRRLAEDLGYPFVELSLEVEKLAGCTIPEVQALYGINAYRRYEQRALEETIQIYPEAVIATPGGLVSEAGTFNLLLGHCTTVWLKADPEDHMQRVLDQGDMRPMADSQEAMADLEHILEGRIRFYSKADITLNTSAGPLEPTFQRLREQVRRHLRKAESDNEMHQNA